MSSPTPGSDPDHPQGNPPQGQPGWGTPPPPPPSQGYGSAPQGYGGPAQPYGGPPPAYSSAPDSGTGQRPGMVTGAAVTGIVWGTLVALFGLLGLLGASAIDDLGIEITAIDIILGLLGIAAAVALLVGGIQVLQGKAPRLLLLAAYAGLGLWLLGVIWSVIGGYGFSAFSLVTLIVLGAIVALLMQPQAKQYFAARGQGY